MTGCTACTSGDAASGDALVIENNFNHIRRSFAFEQVALELAAAGTVGSRRATLAVHWLELAWALA